MEVHRLSGARLCLISSGRRSLGMLDAIVDRLAWTPEVAATISNWDIALAPLVDGRFERGKCAYKVLQYGAAGLPTVVSPVGANTPVSRHLRYPMARTGQEWVDAIMDLLRSPDAERAVMGRGARAAVEARYSYAAWASQWLQAVGER
jgi:glycosyltransferase involved in cell wall biosynthesis